MAIELNIKALSALPNNVNRPQYSKESLSPGIVHIGVGNFHRAHQAMYLHQLFNSGQAMDWAILGAGTKSYDVAMRDKLKTQDWLTTVVELDTNGLTAHVCGSMIGFIDNNEKSLIEALCKPEIRIVSLTITEGGYYMNDKTGGFNLAHVEIQNDIANFANPTTVFGVLIKALETRYSKNIKPFTVMSCDNIPHNGGVTKRAVIEMATQINREFAKWIADNVSFPNSMVDCITPATSALERERLVTLFDIQDNAPVFCEPFRQWVMEDNFVNGRPPLENVGVEFVDDVAPFELMKLRILNGGHASIAYPAALLGIHYVHDVMANSLVSKYLKKLVHEEIIPTLDDVPGVNFNEYAALIESRFANSEVRDTVPRLCQDASNRLPKFILPIITANLQHGNDCKGLSLVVALWCALCLVDADTKKGTTLDDVQAPRLIKQALLARENPSAFLEMNDIFGELSQNEQFNAHFKTWLTMLLKDGVECTLEHYLT